MGCDLVYVNRALVQIRTTNVATCRVWYANSNTENSKSPLSIRKSTGPNRWANNYLFPPKGTRDLAHDTYYSIEGVEDGRLVFVDSSGDAWFFKDRINFEAAIANYYRQGAAFHLVGAIHYSQVNLPKRTSPIANRYERILRNMVVEPEPTPVVASVGKPENDGPVTYDEIKEILDFEFNRPKPPKLEDPLGLDFDSIIKEALKES